MSNKMPKVTTLMVNLLCSIGIKRLVGTGYSIMKLEVDGAHEPTRMCSMESNTCTADRLLAAGKDVKIAFTVTNIGRSNFHRFADGAAVLGSLNTGGD